MNPLDDNVADGSTAPDGDDHTIMVNRATATPNSTPDASEDGDDHTVMVSRDTTPDSTLDASEDGDDHTIMVNRATPAPDGDGDDHTVMVNRATPAPDGDGDDHTVMVNRATATPNSTPDASEDGDDHTVVVGRTPAKAAGAARPSLGRPVTAARRRGITPPPVPDGFAPKAVEAAGVGATEAYRPRDIPAPPAPAPAILQGPDATREASATMPSVARHSRITARVAMAVFVTSCAASVVGLTLIALALV